MKVLYFGRAGSSHSEKILDLMGSAGHSVTFIPSSQPGEKIPDSAHLWSGDLIVSFRSYFILPTTLLDKAAVAAINFHPGPPEYPGWGGASWALMDEATHYGSTAHLMSPLVDEGPILRVDRFPIETHDNLLTLMRKSHDSLLELALGLVGELMSWTGLPSHCPALTPTANEEWTGPAKRASDLEKLKRVPADISGSELERLVRAAHHPDSPLYTEINGARFVLDA